MNAAQKLIASHLVSGDLTPGGEIAIRIDQTLTQDSTGTMAYLQLEAMGTDRVKTKRSVAYVDHNMLQSGFENADDHKYIQTVAAKHGIWFSRPGNCICHQVQLERFSVPGQTLLVSDSHTPDVYKRQGKTRGLRYRAHRGARSGRAVAGKVETPCTQALRLLSRQGHLRRYERHPARRGRA